MQINKLFLVKVYRQNKLLFWLFSFFIFFSGYFNYKGIETTPFFVYGMFSGKMKPKQEYKIITLTYNDGKVFNLPHTYQEPKSMMVYFTINHYRKIAANKMQDPMEQVLGEILPKYPFLPPFKDRIISTPAENARYLPWLKTYLHSIVGEPIKNANIIERYIHFRRDGRVVEDSSKLLYSIR